MKKLIDTLKKPRLVIFFEFLERIEKMLGKQKKIVSIVDPKIRMFLFKLLSLKKMFKKHQKLATLLNIQNTLSSKIPRHTGNIRVKTSRKFFLQGNQMINITPMLNAA